MRCLNLKLLLSGILTLTIAASTSVIAKPINLYDLPKLEARVVATIESNSMMVPIFTNPTGEWMKVGDPKNGNVGWIKVSEVSQPVDQNGIQSTGFSMMEKTVSTPKGPQTNRVIQFGPPASNPSTVNAMQKQQWEIQKYTQEMVDSVTRDVNAALQANPYYTSNMNSPVFVPIVVVPVPQASGSNPPPAPMQNHSHPSAIKPPQPLPHQPPQ